MEPQAADSLARARALANAGWTTLLQKDDAREGRAKLAEARRVLAEALKSPGPQNVRFELVGVLAELSSQLGDPGTVARCAALLPSLAPKEDPALVEGLLRRMVDRWGAHDSAESGVVALQHVLGPQRAAAVRAVVERRRRLLRDAPLSTRQILALRAHLAQLGLVELRAGEVIRNDADGLKHTSAWLESQNLPTIACLDHLGLLGGTTDAEILLSVEPLEPYDVPAAWPAVALARRVRAAERARGARTPGPASGSVSVSAPVDTGMWAARGTTGPAPAPAAAGGSGSGSAWPAPGGAAAGGAAAGGNWSAMSGGIPAGIPGVSAGPAAASRPPARGAGPARAPAATGPVGGGTASGPPVPKAPPHGFEVPFQDPYSRFRGVFLDDGMAGYIYLLDRSGQRRLMTPLWVYNRIPAPDRMPAELSSTAAGPPMEAASLLDPEPRYLVRPDQIDLHMADDGAWVAVQLDGRLAALLDYHQRVGWSRLLARDTPYGLAWTADLPESL